MELLLNIITLIILMNHCDDSLAQGTDASALTPPIYYFSVYEDAGVNDTLGTIYTTSNFSVTITYTIESSFFQISNLGVITVIGPVDYENIAHRLLSARVSGTSTGTVTLCLQDRNDNAPTQLTTTSLTIKIKNSLAAMTNIWKFRSTDADSNENGRVTFSLPASGGGGGGGGSNDNNKFSIDSSGILQNISPFNSNKNFIVDVIITDGGSPSLTNQLTFSLSIVEQSDLVLDQDRYVFTVNEDVSTGTIIGTIPASTHPVLALIPTPVNFQYDASTGQITVVNPFDYESQFFFNFSIVNASNTNVILGELVIFINNVVDIPPNMDITQIIQTLPKLSIAGSTVYCPSQVFSEEDAIVTFELFSSFDIFSVDSSTGTISLTRSIAYDIPSAYKVILQLTDRGLSSNLTINFITSPSNAPLPSQPQSLSVMFNPSPQPLDDVSWLQPEGIYPRAVFPQGLQYMLTYQPLNNLIDIHTMIPDSFSVAQLFLASGDIYFIRVSASLIGSEYGPSAVTTYAKGNENTTATVINSTSIRVSWDELQYCFSDYHIQYEIIYYGVNFDNQTRTLTLNITEVFDPLSNTTSCQPQFVFLTDLLPLETYYIVLRVTIDELGVDSALIAAINEMTSADSISISPDYPLCSGESVSISCLIYASQYSNASGDFVYFSFNNSIPLSNEINSTNRTNNGIDISNIYYQVLNDKSYGSGTIGQLDILSFTQEISTVEFGCHLKTGNDSFTNRLLTTGLEKAVAPSKPNCSHSIVYFNSSTCYFNMEIYWYAVFQNRPNVIYHLKENGTVLFKSTLPSFSFNLSSKAVPSTNFSISLSAENCAGESDGDTCFATLIPGYFIQNNSFSLDFEESRGNLQIFWNLVKFPSDAVDAVILVGYSIEIYFDYLLCDESDYYDYIYGETDRNIAISSQNSSSYTINLISPPAQLAEIYIQATISINDLCGETVTPEVFHTNNYEFVYAAPLMPTCSGNIVALDPYTCNATHLIIWQNQELSERTLYFNNQALQVEIPSEIDFRRIQPNTSYNYTLISNSTNGCYSNSEEICLNSIIPGYEFDPDGFALSYSPETENLTVSWGFFKVPAFAPAQVIALKFSVFFKFENKFVNGDRRNSSFYAVVILLSNITTYSFALPESPGTLEALNVSVSSQIIEQCGFKLNNNLFTLTYNYTMDACREGDTSCFKDSDGDGYPDTRMFCMNFDSFCKDNCPTIYNREQDDCNGNDIGDACDTTCEPETDQIFFYNWICTEGGETEYVPCIQGGGNASRLCKENGNWSDLIDTSNCFSPEYEVFRGNVSIDKLEDIAKVVTEKEPASAGDIGLIVDVLNTTIEATLNVSTTERENIVNNTLKIVNVLAANSTQILLRQSQETTNVAQMVINILERQASSLALNQPTNVRLNTTENVFIETQKINLTQAQRVVINADNIKGEKEGQTTPSVIVPIPKNIDPQKSLSVSVVVIKNIANLITSFADAITVGTGGLKLSGFSDFQIVSPVIIVQLFLDNEQITGNGTNPLIELYVPLSLSGLDLVQNYIKPTCLALNDTSSSNPQWYDGGIRNVSSNDIDSDNLVRCLSFHATPFVVLVGVGNLESQSVVLNILSYVGCSLSVICLLISLVIYLLFGRKLLKKIYHFVHFQLALSLCLLYLAFLFGVEPAYANVWLYIPCKIVTVVVEYLLLVVFLWMLMEGLVVLIMIMWPFHQFGWKHFVIFSLLSWGIPLLYVIPFIPFFHEYYISPPLRDSSIVSLTNEAKYCFLHNDETTNLILSVTIPLALIIILNVIILTAVIIRCILIITQQRSFSKLQRAQKTSLRLLRLLIVMFPVLGFGWTFGLLAIYFNTAVFAWVFTILCAFQGIIFLIFVLLIRLDIQQSIVNALNLKATFLTMQSKISSKSSKPVSTKESQLVTKQSLNIRHPIPTAEPDLYVIESVDDLETLSKLFWARESGVFPPTVELEDMLMFYEDRHWPWVDLDVKNQEPEIDPVQTEYLFDKIATQITGLDSI